MPDVINLGQFAAPRDSDFSGLADALKSGMVIGETIRHNKVDEANQASLIQQKLNSSKTYSEAVTNEKANLDFKKNQDNRKYAYQTLKNWSMILNDKSPQEQDMLKQSDHGQEVENLIKTYLPEYYDKDTKQVQTLTDKTINKDHVDQLTAAATQRVAGGTGTQADINLLKLQSKDPSLLTEALTYAQKQIRQDGNQTHENFMSHVKDFFAKITKPKLELKSNVELGPTTDMTNRDPLGILSR